MKNIARKCAKEKSGEGAFSAIILSAGYGLRFRPFTDFLPKPLAPICGRPLLMAIADKIFSAGCSEVIVNLHHKAGKIVEAFAGTDHPSLSFSMERRILGTGGAILNCRQFLEKEDFFLLHNGDVISDADLGLLLSHHRRSGLAGTLLLVDGGDNKISAERGVISGIKGHCGSIGKSGLMTYSGIAAFSRRVFDFFPSELHQFPLIEVFSRMIENGELGAFVPDRIYWRDIGSLSKYFSVHEEILLRKLFMPAWLKPSDRPFSGGLGRIGGVSLRGFVSAPPGGRCEIRKGAKLENCILLDGATLRSGEFRRDEIIGKGFSVHRDSNEIMNLGILKESDFRRIRISSLQEQGSNRRFYRLDSGGRREVLMVSGPDDQDFARFMKIGRYLDRLALGVPRIRRANLSSHSVLMEDLGDATLNRALRSSGAMAGRLLEKAIRFLVEFQNRTMASAERNVKREFGFDGLRWESQYFMDNFLAKFAGVEIPDFPGIDEEFDAVAREALSSPRVLCHRDFQSQNIMIFRNRIRIVDFQGARMGPLAYDLMSLLRDAYIEISEDEIARLTAYYHRILCRSGLGRRLDIPLRDFAKFASSAALQRNMQALGAFAFLGLVKGKKSYLGHIPRGLLNLRGSIRKYQEHHHPIPMIEKAVAKIIHLKIERGALNFQA